MGKINPPLKILMKLAEMGYTQKAMAELFGVQIAISKHLKNIFAEGELDENVVISKMEIATAYGAMSDKTQTKETQFYNLDAIISVGYRVNSAKATSRSQCILYIFQCPRVIESNFSVESVRLEI